jgi:hypothetical protein
MVNVSAQVKLYGTAKNYKDTVFLYRIMLSLTRMVALLTSERTAQMMFTRSYLFFHSNEGRILQKNYRTKDLAAANNPDETGETKVVYSLHNNGRPGTVLKK